MRRYVGRALALIVLLGLSGVAMAADLAVKARPVPPPAYDWTGFYIGVHGGGDWEDKDWNVPLTPINIAAGGCPGCPTGAGDHGASGWLAGAQAGVNYQVSNHPGSNIVLGVEVDGSWTDLHGASVSLFDPTVLLNSKTDTLATFAARGGLAVDRLFVYAKAGGAYDHDKYFTTLVAIPTVAFQSTNRNNWGWVLGAGLEYAFMGNWSVTAEYNHLEFARRTETLAPLPGCGCVAFQYAIRQQIDLVKVGVNYKFDWATPVVAKF